MTIADLPALNAVLNGTSAVLLLVGFRAIRRREIDRHRRCMTAAFFVSAAFLVSYLVYHWHHGSTPFPGTGGARSAYLVMLVSHILLAAALVPLALVTLYRAYTAQYERHRSIAWITFPVWVYVSVTGVLVYWILYHLYA